MITTAHEKGQQQLRRDLCDLSVKVDQMEIEEAFRDKVTSDLKSQVKELHEEFEESAKTIEATEKTVAQVLEEIQAKGIRQLRQSAVEYKRLYEEHGPETAEKYVQERKKTTR